LAARLARDLKPVRRRSVGFDMAAMALLAAVQLALVLGFGAMRPDMRMAMAQPSFWWKLASLGTVALVGAITAILSFDPAASPRRGLRAIAVLLAACLLSGGLLDARGEGLAALGARLDWQSGLQCAAKMALLSLPALCGLGLFMRRGAATQPGPTALAVGLASASWGAFVFVFACPFDDPFYIAVWYALGCGLVTLAARLLLPVLTRW
jgi:hypothetical protein